MWPAIKRFIFDARFALALLGAAGSQVLAEVTNPHVALRVVVPVIILAGGLYKQTEAHTHPQEPQE